MNLNEHNNTATSGTAGGTVGFVLANGSMSSNQSGECDIRRALIVYGTRTPSHFNR